MIAEDALTGASATTARLVLEDVCPAIAAYVSAPLDQTEEMRVAMCLARFVETACAVASRRDVSEMILPLVVSAVNAPSAHLATEGPTPKRELFELATVKAMRSRRRRRSTTSSSPYSSRVCNQSFATPMN